MATQPLHQILRSGLDSPMHAPATDRRDSHGRYDCSGPEGDLRRVLIIASRFPPLASVGAIRIRKFVKYLGEFGWKPTVLTGPIPRGGESTEDARCLVDAEGLNEIPSSIDVARLEESIDEWPLMLSTRWGRRFGSITRHVGWSEVNWRDGLQWRFERLQNRLAFPDRGVWRTMAALRLARSLHRKHRFHAIFSTGMPFSDHLIGWVVCRALRLPWIADFRDPWFEYIHWKQWRGQWGALATQRAELAVVRTATRVVCVNHFLTERFQSRYPTLAKEKFETVENGFDPSDFSNDGARVRNPKFTIQYAGSLYGARSPENLIKAFERFCARCERAQSEAELVFLGRAGTYLDRIQNAAHQNVRYGGLLKHSATCRAMRQADVNVVLLPQVAGSELDVPAKLYECLGSGRPVLAALPLSGSAAHVMRDRPLVYLHDPEDIEGMSACIETLFNRWRCDDLPDRAMGADLYPQTRRASTERLAEILNQCCPSGIPEAAR